MVAIPTGRAPHQPAVGEGAVWVSNENDNTVSRIDPASNQVAATSKAIWVSGGLDPRVSRIDPAGNRVAARITVGQETWGVAVGEGGVWAITMSTDTLSMINPTTNKVAAERAVKTGDGPLGIAIGQGAMGANKHDNTVWRIDPQATVLDLL